MPPTVPADPNDVTQLAQSILAAITTGNWWLVAALVVMFLVMALRSDTVRKLLPEKVGAAFDNPAVALSLPILSAMGLGLATAAVAGPVTAPVLIAVALGAIKVSMGAISTYVGARKLAEARELGAAKAAAIDSKASAVNALKD